MNVSYTYGSLVIEWNTEKAEQNLRKHHVSFQEAASAFFDERGRIIPDPDHSDDEERYVFFGMSRKLRILVVCHCYRNASGLIRIISARKANRRERGQYGAR